MQKLLNISNKGNQTFYIPYLDGTIKLNLRFLVAAKSWHFNIEYNGTPFKKHPKVCTGIKCTVGILHLKNDHFPFDIAIIDTLGLGIDPFKLDDFSSGRCVLILIPSNKIKNFSKIYLKDKIDE